MNSTRRGWLASALGVSPWWSARRPAAASGTPAAAAPADPLEQRDPVGHATACRTSTAPGRRRRLLRLRLRPGAEPRRRDPAALRRVARARRRVLGCEVRGHGGLAPQERRAGALEGLVRRAGAGVQGQPRRVRQGHERLRRRPSRRHRPRGAGGAAGHRRRRRGPRPPADELRLRRLAQPRRRGRRAARPTATRRLHRRGRLEHLGDLGQEDRQRQDHAAAEPASVLEPQLLHLLRGAPGRARLRGLRRHPDRPADHPLRLQPADGHLEHRQRHDGVDHLQADAEGRRLRVRRQGPPVRGQDRQLQGAAARRVAGRQAARDQEHRARPGLRTAPTRRSSRCASPASIGPACCTSTSTW